MMSNRVLTMLSSNTNNVIHQKTSIVTVKKKKKGHSRPNKENTNIKRKVHQSSQNTAQKVHNLNVKHQISNKSCHEEILFKLILEDENKMTAGETGGTQGLQALRQKSVDNDLIFSRYVKKAEELDFDRKRSLSYRQMPDLLATE